MNEKMEETWEFGNWVNWQLKDRMQTGAMSRRGKAFRKLGLHYAIAK
jgi:hypothetical protein